MAGAGTEGPGLGCRLRLTWVTDRLEHVLEPAEFAAEHGQLGMAALKAHLARDAGEGAQLWEQLAALWSQAWPANCQALELMQNAGPTRFSPARPQRWVIASFEHHTSPHGLPHPHIHNIVIPALTTSAGQ